MRHFLKDVSKQRPNDEESGESQDELGRQISWTAACRSDAEAQDSRLVGCSGPCPTSLDAPEAEAPKYEFAEFQRRATQLAEEFFCSHEIEGMVASVGSLGCGPFHDELAAILLRLSMDRKDAEREAVVPLLNALAAAECLSRPQLARGFEKLVLSWDDLRLDVPDATAQLAGLLSAKVHLLDRALFSRLPEGFLRRLHDSLGAGAERTALGAHLEELVAFKQDLKEQLVAVFFRDQAVESFSAWLRSADKAVFHHEVVLALCLGSIGGGAGEQGSQPERFVLGLLASLGSEDGALLTDVDVQMGFSRLLGTLGQTPTKERKEQVVGLLRGAVRQELLPAEFLKSARRMRFGGLHGVEAVRQAQRQTPMHSRRTWGSGDAQHFRNEVREAILEYFDSGGAEELGNIVEELHLSQIEQVRFMRKLMVTGLERGDGDGALDAVEALLGRCWGTDEVRAAFEQLRDIAKDLVLDLPKCREQTSDLVWAAVGRGLLEKSDLIQDGATIV